MGRLTVTWSEPGGPAGLCVFGVVVDARALGAGRFVVGCPCDGAPGIDVPVVPLAGLEVAVGSCGRIGRTGSTVQVHVQESRVSATAGLGTTQWTERWTRRRSAD